MSSYNLMCAAPQQTCTHAKLGSAVKSANTVVMSNSLFKAIITIIAIVIFNENAS